MKTITLWQPWASLIASQHKRYETRSWSTRYRGNLAIHASKRWTRHEVAITNQLYLSFSDELSVYSYETLPLGCIVCAVRLVNCHPVETVRDGLSSLERAVGNYDDNRFAWELEFIKVPGQPIPATGKQGLWEWNNE